VLIDASLGKFWRMKVAVPFLMLIDFALGKFWRMKVAVSFLMLIASFLKKNILNATMAEWPVRHGGSDA
jgi:predicted acetyltransferase